MARSLKKGPYIDFRLDNKVQVMNDSGKKSVIKTWSRRSMISPDFVGHTFAFVCFHLPVISGVTQRKKTKAKDRG